MKRLFIIFCFITSLSLLAQEVNVVAVGEATLKKEKLYFKKSSNFSPEQLSFQKIIEADFVFYKKYFELNSNIVNNPIDGIVIDLTFSSPLDFKVSVKKTGDLLPLLLESGKIKREAFRESAHVISDSIYKKISGKQKSIFLSKIFFVSDRNGSRAQPIKELYSMDFDGFGIKQLTHHRGIIIGPSVSFDRTKIVYSLIRGNLKKRNIDLMLMNTITNKIELLSSKPGINSGAIFFPDDKKIALTLSYTGNAEIFEMDLTTKALRKITDSFSEDVDPSISPDSKKMVFLSDRPGKAMIYLLDPMGTEKDVQRIGFVGQYNATPRFSPDGSFIAFASWVDECFDIFRLSSDGSSLVRLTKNFGSNEDPSFSPDNEFIVFSSQRVLSRTKAVQDLYIMDKDGELIGKITQTFGNCITPRWSN